MTLDSVLAKYNFDFPFHPEVLKLGVRYADGSIKGANARCIALLDMLRQMLQDYTTPAGALLSAVSRLLPPRVPPHVGLRGPGYCHARV